MKNFKDRSVKLPTLIIAVAVIIAAVLILNPAIIPFISGETKDALSEYLSDYYAAIGKDGALSLSRLIAAGVALLIVMALNRIVMFGMGRIKLNSGRSKTMVGVIKSVVNYTMFIMGVLWALSILGLNVAGLFAGIGIVSLIVGFGAQSLIEDVITGFFIIFEGQYNIGDIIVLDGFRGEVRKIGVRTTVLEDASGTVKIVNNSDVRNMQNRSRKPSAAICDIRIGYNESIERVEGIIKDALPDVTSRAGNMFKTPIQYLGVQQLAQSSVILRIVGYANEHDIFDAQRYLNREMKMLFDKNNINIPFPQMDIHNK